MIHFLDEGVKVIKCDSLGGICEIKPFLFPFTCNMICLVATILVQDLHVITYGRINWGSVKSINNLNCIEILEEILSLPPFKTCTPQCPHAPTKKGYNSQLQF